VQTDIGLLTESHLKIFNQFHDKISVRDPFSNSINFYKHIVLNKVECYKSECAETFIVYVRNNVMCAIARSYLYFFRVRNNTCRQLGCRQSGMLAKVAVGKMCANEAVGNRECKQTGFPFQYSIEFSISR